MRIIDKNTDFYDYLQNIYRDTSVTFDRTDSFILTKEMFCDELRYGRRYVDRSDPYRYILLQVGNTFWLFLVTITEYNSWDEAKKYDIELITTWKNYNKPRCLINLDIIHLGWGLRYQIDYAFRKSKGATFSQKLQESVPKLIQAVDQNEYDLVHRINKHLIYCDDGRKLEKHIPLLIACGIGNCIDPLDIFLSFEEYFSLEKQSQERTESVGITDVEKVENHGFDKKTSFRGKK